MRALPMLFLTPSRVDVTSVSLDLHDKKDVYFNNLTANMNRCFLWFEIGNSTITGSHIFFMVVFKGGEGKNLLQHSN